jgi:hypothetical protein
MADRELEHAETNGVTEIARVRPVVAIDGRI